MSGFTLLEMLVVLLLVGIITTFAVLATGDGGRERQVALEAERFAALVLLAGDEAVLQSREYGVQLSEDGYRFMVFVPGEKSVWRALEQDALLHARRLPQAVRLELLVDDLPVVLTDKRDVPQLLLTSSGERTPFELRLRSDDVLWRVVAGPEGKPGLLAGEG